jgi:hypothetical protein
VFLNFQPFHRGHLTKNTVCDSKTRQGSLNSPADNIYRRQDFLQVSCEGPGNETRPYYIKNLANLLLPSEREEV